MGRKPREFCEWSDCSLRMRVSDGQRREREAARCSKVRKGQRGQHQWLGSIEDMQAFLYFSR